jgi:hypothetical protein
MRHRGAFSGACRSIYRTKPLTVQQNGLRARFLHQDWALSFPFPIFVRSDYDHRQ